jgi:RNA polymerase sigma-70 factor (ECF subfamily)
VSERSLIAAAKRGDARAYETLVRPYEGVAWRTALVILRDATDAEDAVQSALLKAWQHLARFRDDSPFRPWLLRIVANEAKNVRVARQRGRDRTTNVDDQPSVAAREPDVLDTLVVAERSRDLVARINRLPLPDREILHLKYTLELTEPEIAGVLDIARGTVKSRLSRAIERLRQSYQEVQP